MLVPALVDLGDENDDWQVFIGSAFLIGAFCTLVATATRRKSQARLSQRYGFLLVTTIWVFAPTVASLPLYFSSLELSYAGAFFEAMSGLTTTGGTAISGLDVLPRGLLMWRSLMQWMGGIGIIGMAILILPLIHI